MPRPPGGFRAELYPLKHRMLYSFGLSCATETLNSAWITLVRNAGTGQTAPTTTIVNPHNTDIDLETGPACTSMSIIDNLKISMSFANQIQDRTLPKKISWIPFFCAFKEKYDAADDDTSATVASIMALTKDDSVEDIVPLTTNKLPVDGGSELPQPVSTVNLGEVFGTYNMTTNTAMEDTVFDNDAFHKLLVFGTNKGALKACLGRTRHITLSDQHPIHNVFIRKFVPKQIRRIVPFTYFGILVHCDINPDAGQYYWGSALSATKAHIGIKCLVTYDEWHPDHVQDNA